MSMQGKVAVITGASSGIGLAAARLFQREGAQVVSLSRRAVEGVETVPTDVSRPQALAAAMEQIRARHGRIDALVLSAGVAHAPPLAELDEAHYDALMDVNCRGATFAFVRALPLLARGASVVFVGSVAGRKGQPGDAVYAGSKGYLRAFARNAGTDPDLLARGIRVNVVSPGPIDTPFTHEATSRPEVSAYVEGLVPMHRWGRADEVARAILFLATDASSFTTGAELTVDGGMAHA